ncbi:MAG: dual specificity protein phosphatase family protein [Chloroflexi bacterium]|nr:dual specificity protein phosphatase family protein [Chloroflexota bacterium]
MSSPSLPFSTSYWVIPNRFLAGEYPGSFNGEESTRKKMDVFLEAGLDTFIDLTYPGERAPYKHILLEQARYYQKDVRVHHFPIEDFGVVTPETMRALLNTIDAALAEGRNIYLHCWAGVGRTGTTVGCYLVRHGMTGDEALAQLARWWATDPRRFTFKRTLETDEQVQFVRGWHELA